MKIFAVVIFAILVVLAGNTHRFLPVESDPCQTDMSHIGHVDQLQMFHCIGHTEYVVAANEKDLKRVASWDHIHEWMTLEWHIEQGFSEAHAVELLALSK